MYVCFRIALGCLLELPGYGLKLALLVRGGQEETRDRDGPLRIGGWRV